MDILISVIIGLTTGVIAGVYAGIVVARVSRFEELRNELKRIIHGIEYVYDGSRLQIWAKKDITEIPSIASDFLAFRHRAAGEETLRIFQQASTLLNTRGTTFEQISSGHSRWQEICRHMRPNYRIILSLKPWL